MSYEEWKKLENKADARAPRIPTEDFRHISPIEEKEAVQFQNLDKEEASKLQKLQNVVRKLSESMTLSKSDTPEVPDFDATMNTLELTRSLSPPKKNGKSKEFKQHLLQKE
jgi:hypothetical protein